MTYDSVISRFKDKVIVDENGCHIWQSTIKRDGYAQFWMDGKPQKAHHVAYLLFKGKVPVGAWICHTCDVKHCVNPDHLYAGTPKDNVGDMHRRLRFWGRRKLTDEDVKAVFEMRARGLSQTDISSIIGINQPNVSKILRRERQYVNRILEVT